LHHISPASESRDSSASVQGIEIYEKLTFSLNDFIDSNQQTVVKRRGRHFRQIEEIECTPDGQYALIRCSDVTVILYRFNHLIFPLSLIHTLSPFLFSLPRLTPSLSISFLHELGLCFLYFFLDYHQSC
jgi:hypothetical protein